MNAGSSQGWHLDIARSVGEFGTLIVFDSATRMCRCKVLGGPGPNWARAALLSILDSVPAKPALITTDNSIWLAGIGENFDIPQHVQSPARPAVKSPTERALARVEQPSTTGGKHD